MEKLKNIYYLHKKHIILSFTILSIIFMGCISFIVINNKYQAEEVEQNDYDIVATVDEKRTNNISDDESTIKVDVKGLVNNPGVYELKSGDRVIDAIKLAGGLSSDAYTRYINLSRRLKDENVIIVNSKEEIDVIKKGENIETICESTNDACTTLEEIITNDLKSETVESTQNESADTTTSTKKDDLNSLVNINTASLDELTALKGIGKSKAEKIINYRNTSGAFKSIEDIKNVSGIGETIYAKIKENITI